jgi:sulfur carrier protein ThiS
MATVRFTRNIQRHVECPTREISGSTLRAILDEYFRENEKARGYVLDEQGRIRRHMVVFIDGELVQDRDRLSDTVEANSVIDVIQALSGGRGAGAAGGADDPDGRGIDKTESAAHLDSRPSGSSAPSAAPVMSFRG